ncbi:hypothetical protein CW309_00335 [Pseudomonas hunanensis]|nr:hypothetical protein CW309_00335 [Pseudomonas hunanensis]
MLWASSKPRRGLRGLRGLARPHRFTAGSRTGAEPVGAGEPAKGPAHAWATRTNAPRQLVPK